MPADEEARLIAEQLRHTIDLLRAELEQTRQLLEHYHEIDALKIKALEEQAKDHETRIRSATDGVTQFKMWSGLANGASSITAIAAFVKAWLGS